MEDHTLSLLLHALLLIKDCCLEGLLFAEEPCKQQADVMLSVAVAATGSQPVKVFWKVTTSHQPPLSNWHSWKKKKQNKHKFLGTSSCCRCEDSTSFSFPAQTVSDIWINMPNWLQIHFSHWHSFPFLQVSEILAFCLILCGLTSCEPDILLSPSNFNDQTRSNHLGKWRHSDALNLINM